MKLSQEKLNEMYKEYYLKKNVIATHVFVYSESQKSIQKDLFELYERPECYVNNINYTEMRARDYSMVFGWEDIVIVSVGTIDDVTHKNN